MSTQNVKAAIIDENGGSEKFKIITQEVGSPAVSYTHLTLPTTEYV